MSSMNSLMFEFGVHLVLNMLMGWHLILGAFFVGIWNGVMLQRATETFVAYFQVAWFVVDLCMMNNVARLYLVLGCFLGVLMADFGPDILEMWEEFQRGGKSSSSAGTGTGMSAGVTVGSGSSVNGYGNARTSTAGSVLASTVPAGAASTIVTNSRVSGTDYDGTSVLTRGGVTNTARSQVTTTVRSSLSSTSSSSSMSTLRLGGTAHGDGESTTTRSSRTVTFDEASIANSQNGPPSVSDYGFPVVSSASQRTPGSSSTRVKSPPILRSSFGMPMSMPIPGRQSPGGSIRTTESEQTPRAVGSSVLPTSPSGSSNNRSVGYMFSQPTAQGYYPEELVDQPTLPTPIEHFNDVETPGSARSRSRSPRPIAVAEFLGTDRTRSRSGSRSPVKSRSRSRSPGKPTYTPLEVDFSTSESDPIPIPDPTIGDSISLPNPHFSASTPSKEEQIRTAKDLRRQAIEADDRQRQSDTRRRQAEATQNADEAFMARLQATKEANLSKDLHRRAGEMLFTAHNAGLGREDISVEDLRPAEAVERVLHRLRELKQDGLPELRVDVGFGRFGLECLNSVLASLKNHGFTVIRDQTNARRFTIDATLSKE